MVDEVERLENNVVYRLRMVGLLEDGVSSLLIESVHQYLVNFQYLPRGKADDAE